MIWGLLAGVVALSRNPALDFLVVTGFALVKFQLHRESRARRGLLNTAERRVNDRSLAA